VGDQKYIQNFISKLKGKYHFGDPERWIGNIKVNRKYVECIAVDWMHVDRSRY